MNKTQRRAIAKLAAARPFRNPFIGKRGERFIRVDAATLRAIRQLTQ